MSGFNSEQFNNLLSNACYTLCLVLSLVSVNYYFTVSVIIIFLLTNVTVKFFYFLAWRSKSVIDF